MEDLNEIVVSHDQRLAVRVRDGARLVAEPMPSAWLGSCRLCEAGSMGRSSCDRDLAHEVKQCHNKDRKDGVPIRWRLEGWNDK